MFRIVPSALVLLLLATGCAASSDDDSADVVASFYPLAWAAEQVVGEHARVTNLTSPGQEPHDLELSVQQTAEINAADVALYIKGFQPSVDEAVEQASEVRAVDVHAVADREFETEESEHQDEHGDEHGDDHGDEHGDEHAHDHGSGNDPHFWLDPTRLAAAAEAFTDEMAQVDPDNAADYRAGFSDLRSSLRALDTEFREGLATCRTRAVVVAHDAFSYLGRRYDLHVVPIAGLSPQAEPSAKTLAAIRAEAQEAGVSTIFAERLASPALAKTLASELGLDTAILDPLEGLSEDDDGDYLSVMRENLSALRTANGCS